MDKNKKFLIITITLLMMGLTLLGSLTIYFDPLQVFRETNYGGGEQRQINLGIARNHNYEIAIIGTSTSENILRKDINEIFGMNGVNLSLSGSTNYEHRRMLKTILEAKKAKKITYGLDIFSYNREINEERASVLEYIINPKQGEVIKYLINFDNIKQAIKFIVRGKNKNWIDEHSYWGNTYTYSKEDTLNFNPELQFGAQNLGAIKGFKEGYSLEKMKNNFDEF